MTVRHEVLQKWELLTGGMKEEVTRVEFNFSEEILQEKIIFVPIM